jgi:hypothetical protein
VFHSSSWSGAFLRWQFLFKTAHGEGPSFSSKHHVTQVSSVWFSSVGFGLILALKAASCMLFKMIGIFLPIQCTNANQQIQCANQQLLD